VVAASFYIPQFLAEQVGSLGITLFDFLPTGVDVHSIEPSARAVAQLQGIDAFFYWGAGLDAWAERLAENLEKEGVALSELTQGIALLPIEDEHEAEEEAEEEGHEHGQFDPHTWLDPLLLARQAETVGQVLMAIDAQGAQDYSERTNDLRQRLQSLDAEFRQGLNQCRLREIIVSHDAFSYMAKAYGFTVIPIKGISTESEPSARAIGEISKLAKEHGIKHIFFETLSSPKLSEAIAQEVGAETLILNPIEGLTAEERAAGKDYFDLMRENLANLRLAMECE
jgi:zinc transport system substrate-binding protein